MNTHPLHGDLNISYLLREAEAATQAGDLLRAIDLLTMAGANPGEDLLRAAADSLNAAAPTDRHFTVEWYGNRVRIRSKRLRK